MTRTLLRAAAVLAGLAAAGCYTTRVVTSDPTASIYFDGKPLGKGRGEVIRHGLPHRANILVKTEDGRAVRAQVRRTEPPSLKWTLYSVGTCALFCWGYPEEIAIPLPSTVAPPTWDVDPSEDSWSTQVADSKWSPQRPVKKGAPVPAPAAPAAEQKGTVAPPDAP